jgi:hypothetical protein
MESAAIVEAGGMAISGASGVGGARMALRHRVETLRAHFAERGAGSVFGGSGVFTGLRVDHISKKRGVSRLRQSIRDGSLEILVRARS